MFDVLRVGSE